jgi:hypothetical protein
LSAIVAPKRSGTTDAASQAQLRDTTPTAHLRPTPDGMAAMVNGFFNSLTNQEKFAGRMVNNSLLPAVFSTI